MVGGAELLLTSHVLAVLLLVVVMVTQLLADFLEVGVVADALRLCVAKPTVWSENPRTDITTFSHYQMTHCAAGRCLQTSNNTRIVIRLQFNVLYTNIQCNT